CTVFVCVFGCVLCCVFFFQSEDGIRYSSVTGVQTCALPISNFGLIRVPTLVLVDAKGMVSCIYEGASEQLAGVVEQTIMAAVRRSEERRVGKECRCRWSYYP